MAACVIACAMLFAACFNFGKDDEEKPPVTYTVTFVTNGGTPIEAITSQGQKTLENLLDGKTTEKEGMLFVGWYSDETLETEFSIHRFVEEDITLYAAWREYTDYELLEIAVKNTRKDAIIAHDTGSVYLSTTSGYNVVDLTLALDNGVITAGSRASGTRYYKDGMFYYTDSEDGNVKLEEKIKETAAEFLYLSVLGTVNYLPHGFYSTFAPLAMYRTAKSSSLSSFERDGDTFLVTYKGSSQAIQLNWSAEDDPWIYFTAGKKFKFTVRNNRVVKVEQIMNKAAYRTIEFFFEGDEDIPVVAEPKDESSYVQKWHVIVKGRNMIITELNKAELDKTVYGSDYEQITKNQTYYYDRELTQEVEFVDGVAPLNKHLELFHPDVRSEDLIIDSYKIGNIDSTELKLEGAETVDGVKTTILVRRNASEAGYIKFSVTPSPWLANNTEFTVEIVDAQSGEQLTVENASRGKYIKIPRSISRECLIKVTAEKGGYTEYICIKPMP